MTLSGINLKASYYKNDNPKSPLNVSADIWILHSKMCNITDYSLVQLLVTQALKLSDLRISVSCGIWYQRIDL